MSRVKQNMTVANSAVGERFKCLSYTLEMPFKDNADLPDEDFGWSVARCQRLGEDVLTAILAVSPKLR